MKKIISLALVLALSLMLCGTAFATRLDDIMAAGELVVATSPDWPPYEDMDENGDFIGSDISMAKYIAEYLGVTLKVEPQDFNTCLASVGTGSVDLVIAGLTYDESRTATMDFSDYYFNEGDSVVLIRSKDAEKYTDMASLAGATVAVQNGTLQQELAETNLPADATIELITKVTMGFQYLKSGRVDALVVAKVVADGLMAAADDVVLMEESMKNADAAGNCIAVVKGETELMEKINEAIAQFTAEGLYEKWVQEYYGIGAEEEAAKAE